MKAKNSIVKMVQIAILTAIVIILQMLGSFVKIGPTSISLVLIPIVLGGIVIGPSGGTFLGFIFGLITLWGGISGTDEFTHILFTNAPVQTALICLGKAMLAGLAGGLVYKALCKKSTLGASVAAAAAVPIVNTGLFIIGCLFLVKDTLVANFLNGDATAVMYFLVIGCAGINFVLELIVNMVVSPAIHTVSRAILSSSRHK